LCQLLERLSVPCFRKLPELLDHAGPTAAVVLARLGFLRQAAVRHTYMRAYRNGREFPAHNCFLRRIKMPISDPRIDEQPRRIEFKNLSVALEFAHSVDHEVALLRSVAVAASQPRIHLPRFDRATRIGEPEHELCGIGKRLENA